MPREVKPLLIKADGTIVDPKTPEELAFLQGWAPTTVATTKDVAESAQVGRKIRAIAKRCWLNARKAIMKLDEYAEASLIEGWALLPSGMAIEHGWVVRQDGVIIDPTLPDADALYFTGLEWKGRAGIKEFLATEQGRLHRKEPFFFAFGWGGMDSPSMRKCYEDCRAAQDAAAVDQSRQWGQTP